MGERLSPIIHEPENYAEMKEAYLKRHDEAKKMAEHRRETGDLKEFAEGSFGRYFDRTKGERVAVPNPDIVLTEPKSPDIWKKREELKEETDRIAKEVFARASDAVVQKAIQARQITPFVKPLAAK